MRNGLQGNMYINGVAAGSAKSSLPTAVSYNNVNFTIGTDFRDGGAFFKGTMDKIALYSTALSSSQIMTLYNAQK